MEKDIISDKHPLDNTDPFTYDKYQELLSESVCRDDNIPTPDGLEALRCKYVSTNSPFLKIAPLKLEEISLNPYIVKYHRVLYNSEINLIVDMARPKVKFVAASDIITESNCHLFSASKFRCFKL